MIAAILAFLTLGSGHYVAHCRNAPEGCENRVRQLVAAADWAAVTHGVELKLLLAVGAHESGMNPNAIGPTHGELGVYQLHPRGAGRRADRMCKADTSLTLRECRAYAAAQELKRGLTTCDGIHEALGYYNTGRCVSIGYSSRVLAVKARL